VRYERSPPDDTSYLDGVWEVKQQIRREEGFLQQTWEFFSSSYRRNTAHIAVEDGETDDENIVGFSVVRGDGYILFLGVRPERRGEGVGRWLVEKASEDHKKLTCHTRDSNQNAVEFYRHLGFEVERYVGSYYQDGESAVYMSRDDTESLRNRITDAIIGED
jgi:ribosomal protein S18 acetylase RimI-like enzyme